MSSTADDVSSRIGFASGVLTVSGLALAALIKAIGGPLWLALLPPAMGFLLDLSRLFRARAAATRRRRRVLLEHCLLLDESAMLPPLVHSTSPYDVGVTEPAPGLAVPLESVRVYVPRPEDSQIDGALEVRRFVLVVGPSKAGKSRSTFEAVRRVFNQRRLLVPVRGASIQVLLDVHPPVELDETVVWLDDLENYLGNDGLTPGAITQLLSHRNTTIVATMRSDVYARFVSDQFRDKSVTEAMRRANPPVLLGPLTDQESLATHLGPLNEAFVSRVQEVGLGAALAAGPELINRLDHAGNTAGQAVVRAAIDWKRAGMARPIPERCLQPAAAAYWPPEVKSTGDEFASAVEWACQAVYPGASVALLRAHAQAQAEPRGFEPFDFVVDAIERRGLPIPVAAWRAFIDCATPAELLKLGAFAYEYSLAEIGPQHSEQEDVAELAWERASGAGIVGADYNLGILWQRRGDLQRAEAHYATAAAAGMVEGMFNLGVRLDARGQRAAAETWYRAAAERGLPEAMFNLGYLLQTNGDEAGAEEWYGKGASVGDLRSMNNLGRLLEARGETNAAEELYRKLAGSGDANAMLALGALLGDTGRADEASRWYRRAADRGEPAGYYNLGQAARRRGNLDEASKWYEKGASAGNTGSMVGLGDLAKDAGDVESATTWYARASELGDAGGALGMGLVAAESGDAMTAEQSFRKASGLGNRNAPFNLGLMLERRGAYPEALVAYRRGAELGDASAMVNLARLLLNEGTRDEAESWLDRAAEAGQPAAMHNLGVRALAKNDTGVAEEWFLRAARAGERASMLALASLLDARGLTAEAAKWRSAAEGLG